MIADVPEVPKNVNTPEIVNLPEGEISSIPAESIPDRQVEEYTKGADFTWVVSALISHRDEILERWLDAVTKQPFHHDRKESAVADHIPNLLDALI